MENPGRTKSFREIELQNIPEKLAHVPTGVRGFDAVGKNPPRLTPMQAIILAAIGGHLSEATQSGTPVDTVERGKFVNAAVQEAARQLDKGEKVEKLNMGVVAEYQFLRKLGAFRLDMGRKSIRDQIHEAGTQMEVNLIYASAMLDKGNMKGRTWKNIERAREVRLQELASWAMQEKLKAGVSHV